MNSQRWSEGKKQRVPQPEESRAIFRRDMTEDSIVKEQSNHIQPRNRVKEVRGERNGSRVELRPVAKRQPRLQRVGPSVPPTKTVTINLYQWLRYRWYLNAQQRVAAMERLKRE